MGTFELFLLAVSASNRVAGYRRATLDTRCWVSNMEPTGWYSVQPEAKLGSVVCDDGPRPVSMPKQADRVKTSSVEALSCVGRHPIFGHWQRQRARPYVSQRSIKIEHRFPNSDHSVGREAKLDLGTRGLHLFAVKIEAPRAGARPGPWF